ncbi:long-chain-fatty-acid--CoA ligase [Alkalihalobacterium alkalinitrilicum]|uniref:long-chain-fatty-acid--CoA ligase n=1 Tax=Alkalihalobacterium alkalinitrilicum TaxID=427920 RepID=UPI000994C954|nr:long-chain-fatty-acid--CoA ligase [Alkalihalobacterium alkalinitrilicum]
MNVENNLIHRVNVGDILKRSMERYPNKTAIVEGDQRYSYTEFNAMVNKAANVLLSLGLGRGDKIALLSSNSIEFLQIYFACAKAGVTIVPINLALVTQEINYILNDSKAKLIIAEDTYLDKLPEHSLIPSLKYTIVIQNKETEAINNNLYIWNSLWENESDQEVQVEVDDRDLMQCLYTSGTTSNPKGVMSSHVAVYLQTLGTAFDLKFTENDISVAMMPLYHTAQLNALTTPVIIAGGTTIIMKAFEPKELLRLIDKERVTQIFGLPMMYRSLMDHPDLSKTDLSSLRLSVYAMTPMPNNELKRAIETFGCDFTLLFGQTEMAPVTTVFRPEHQLTKTGAVGTAGVNVDVSIMDDDGNILPNGEIGEIVYRSPQTMEGYLNDKDKTKDAFKSGWFHSGDYGYLDEDKILWFVDRKKDIVKSGGVNVSSIEVEKVLLQNEGVENAVVVGLPHRYWIEALTAFIIPKQGVEIDEAMIIKYCKTNLGKFKVPKKVVVVDEFPLTSTGKIQKHIIREKYKSLFEGVESK